MKKSNITIIILAIVYVVIFFIKYTPGDTSFIFQAVIAGILLIIGILQIKFNFKFKDIFKKK